MCDVTAQKRETGQQVITLPVTSKNPATIRAVYDRESLDRLCDGINPLQCSKAAAQAWLLRCGNSHSVSTFSLGELSSA